MIEIVLIIFNDDFEILLEKIKTQAVIKKVHSPKALSMKSRLNVIVYT